MLNVEYHVSQYTDIINSLKQEITGLKAQLNLGGNLALQSPAIGLHKNHSQMSLMNDNQTSAVSSPP